MKNKYVIKFINMNFEEKKVEIMRLLKDLLEHSIRAKKLYKIIPSMEENQENTEILISNYTDLISAIDKVEKEKEEEKKKEIEKKVKKLEENRKLISEKIKDEEKENEQDLENLFNKI